MKNAYVFLAEGFEEIEAITPIDLLRRAGVMVYTVGVNGKRIVGAHAIPVDADIDGTNFVLPDDADLVLLPGGGLGTENLGKSETVQAALAKAQSKGIYIAAICAAPTVLHEAGLLHGKKVTAFPAVQAELENSIVTGEAVVQDGNIITARSAGVALQFAEKCIEVLCGTEKATEIIEKIVP